MVDIVYNSFITVSFCLFLDCELDGSNNFQTIQKRCPLELQQIVMGISANGQMISLH